MVERYLAKVQVAGSNPVSRSKHTKPYLQGGFLCLLQPFSANVAPLASCSNKAEMVHFSGVCRFFLVRIFRCDRSRTQEGLRNTRTYLFKTVRHAAHKQYLDRLLGTKDLIIPVSACNGKSPAGERSSRNACGTHQIYSLAKPLLQQFLSKKL